MGSCSRPFLATEAVNSKAIVAVPAPAATPKDLDTRRQYQYFVHVTVGFFAKYPVFPRTTRGQHKERAT